MTETGSDRSKVLRIVATVGGILLVVAVVCCAGGWLVSSQFAEQVEKAWGPMVEGSGVVTKQERIVPPFTAIRAQGLIDVDVRIGEPQSVTLTADHNVLPQLTTEVVNGTLVLGSEGRFVAKTDVRATIVVPSLTGITIEGMGDITVKGVDEPTFGVSILGAGGATVSGRTDTLDVDITGMGDADLADLVARTATVRLLGQGDAEVDVRESLDAKVTGMGDVVYHGSPGDVRQEVGGMGSIRPADE